MEEMKFSHNLRKQENSVELMELQTALDTKKSVLERAHSELESTKTELKKLSTDGRLETIEKEIRDFEHIYGLVSASIQIDLTTNVLSSENSTEDNLTTVDEMGSSRDNSSVDEGKNDIDEDNFPLEWVVT